MIILLILLFVYILVILSKNVSPFKKGQLFEQRIYSKLINNFTNSKVINNLYIPFNDKYTEIDCLLINRNGIYVIEAKNYSGWIFANSNSKYWMEIHYKKRFKFYNPIKQNKSHIDCLRKIINENITYYNIVVFSNQCQFKELTLSKFDNADVIHYNRLVGVIQNKPLPNNFLNEKMIERIYNNLLKYTKPNKEVVYRHNEYVMYKKMKM